ncbi:TonB-dependent receptor (plasmid) [Gemmatirosa kalamazoonensis]|uniref:TonB-dependent receptor n=1 Tax=Gemmatirosa kalamazoonensis TaxID=861299 RepID=W0RSR6_9BACT|nr:TonB-dependent receptor [Gemmatirosa kalamazoonensis]AHG93517.1 TonB-dependent receptor [Gemmatirosa kalamazoonensis]
MRRTAPLALALLATVHVASAQQPSPPTARPGGAPGGAPGAMPAANGEVRGTVLEGEGSTPIARASITVRARRDSSLVAGAITTPQGAFRVQGLRNGAYLLRIAALGYAPRVMPFAITEAAPRAPIDTVKLTRVAVSLTAVNVTEERAAVAVEPDRTAYRAKDVAPAATNASDVLDAVPSVQVDADGKVSYRGNENVAIQINGRPSPIRGAQLASYLKTLPANVIEKVEVIPNPSAKYDPEGMAGILNIVLKQNVDLGLSGGVNVGAASEDRYNASANLGYQSGPWTTFTTIGVNADDRTVTGVNDRVRHGANIAAPITNQDLRGLNGNGGQNFTTTVDYKFNKRDVLSTAGTLSHRRSTDATTSTYEELNSTQALLDSYDRLRDSRSTGLYTDLSSAFKRTFDPKKKHELSAEVRYNRSHDEDDTGLWRQPLAQATRTENEIDETDAVQQQLVAQVDYTKTFDKRRKLETGAKSDSRWLDRDYGVRKDALGSGTWVRSDLSNALAFDEKVQAAYGVFSQGAGKFDLQAGLRAEYAARDFSLAAQPEHYPYHYTSLFPSGVVMYNASSATQLKASYSRRIRRPGTQELNPFPTFFDVQNVFIGNPKLNPEYTDAYEFGVTRNGKLGTLQLAPFYRRTTNVIRVDIDTDAEVDGRDVTTVSFKNLATSSSWGTDLNGSLRLGRKFNGFAGFNVFKMVTDGGSQSSLGSDAVTWMSRVNGTFNLTSKTTLQGSYMYRAPMKIERGRFAAMQMANVVLRQKIDGEKASVAIRVVDPFNTNKFRIQAGDDNLTQITARRPGVRGVFVSYQYNFGRPPRVRERPQDNQQGGAGFPSGS